MLFLNIFVVYGIKQSTPKLFTVSTNFIVSDSASPIRFQLALLVSKPTTLILFFALLFVLFVGEHFLSILLDFTSTYPTIIAHSWNLNATNLASHPLTTSSTALSLLNYLVLTLALSALRFLYNLRRVLF